MHGWICPLNVCWIGSEGTPVSPRRSHALSFSLADSLEPPAGMNSESLGSLRSVKENFRLVPPNNPQQEINHDARGRTGDGIPAAHAHGSYVEAATLDLIIGPGNPPRSNPSHQFPRPKSLPPLSVGACALN